MPQNREECPIFVDDVARGFTHFAVPNFVPSGRLHAFVLFVPESGKGCVNARESQFMQTTLND